MIIKDITQYYKLFIQNKAEKIAIDNIESYDYLYIKSDGLDLNQLSNVHNNTNIKIILNTNLKKLGPLPEYFIPCVSYDLLNEANDFLYNNLPVFITGISREGFTTKNILEISRKAKADHQNIFLDSNPQNIDIKKEQENIELWKKEGFLSYSSSLLNSGFRNNENLASWYLPGLFYKGLDAVILPEENITENGSFSLASLGLMGRDPNLKKYSAFVSAQISSSRKKTKKNKILSPPEKVFEDILEGEEEQIQKHIMEALDTGMPPKKLVDEYMIAAINRVGEYYEEKIYFLPQLMLSADTMRKGFDLLEPLLMKGDQGKLPDKNKIILATVKGDIHDIGKNIVGLMLKNYHFQVIDLGKDVDSNLIIDKAIETDTKIIGLSALMTTTMVEMKTVIKKAKEKGLTDLRFMIGGAVVDQAYAREIGAHAYAKDAAQAVKIAKSFIKNEEETCGKV